MQLWLPDTHRDEYDPAEGIAKAAEFRARLKEIDERLDLVWVHPGAESFHNPGRWHIVRRGESGVKAAWAITAPDGEGYSDPEEMHLEALKARDASAHPDIWRRHRAAEANRRMAEQLRCEQQHERFREELLDRFNHLEDPRIHVKAEHKEKLDGPLAAPQRAA